MLSKLKTEIRCLGASNLIIGGLLFLFIALLVRLACAPPYTTYKVLGISSFSPPIWLMALAWSIFFFVSGAAFFGALSMKIETVYKYKGGMFFVMSMSLGLAWYPVFFNLKLIFAAFIIAFFTTVFAFACASSYSKISRFLGTVMTLCGFWLTYSMILNLMCIFMHR